MSATGGTITTSGSYRIHSFTNVGTSAFVPAFSGSVEVLIVGGGGGGGASLGGGGGGGGVIYIPSVNVTSGTSYPVEVGQGGSSGTSGGASTVFGATAAGGGTSFSTHPPTYSTGAGTAGGSGGGAAAGEQFPPFFQGGASSGNSLGTNSGTIYGNRGGNMTTGRNQDPTRAAGGGGAGGQGLDTNPNITGDTGQTGMGSGGVGVINAILGPSYYWGGGGGGGTHNNQFGGWGGLGGGGGGSGRIGGGSGGGSALNSGGNGGIANTANVVPGAGGANTGGGGGGGIIHNIGGAGGSGIVIIRYIQFFAPNAPTSVTASAGNTQAVVNWTAPANNGGSAITNYTVTSSPGNFQATTGNGSTTTATVTGLTNGTAYTFTVVATNVAGNSPASLASTSITPRTIPNSPTGVTASAGNAQAVVNWTASANNGGSAITSYTVTSSPGELTAITADGLTTTATVIGLTNDTAYTFTVVATNVAGNSAASAASSSVTPIAPILMHNFNSTNKSWAMYSHTLSSISGDDLTLKPYVGKNVILEVSENNSVFIKKGTNVFDLSNLVSGQTGSIAEGIDVSFANIDISENLNPLVINSSSLGSASKNWNNAYINNIYGEAINTTHYSQRFGNNLWNIIGQDISNGPPLTNNNNKIAISNDGKVVAFASAPGPVLRNASGGAVTISGGYVIHRFDNSGTFTSTFNGQVEVLLVGGGGGGGNTIGGGGGGGGVIYMPAVKLSCCSRTWRHKTQQWSKQQCFWSNCCRRRNKWSI
jgi:hypothetical protein